MNIAHEEVLFEEVRGEAGHLGLITLNRPEVLNSLTLTMVHAIHDYLQLWATSDHIKAVIIQAAPGRAFCAGGDLRLLYDRHLAGDSAVEAFFHDEYLLNRFIFHYPKPYIALLDGITMGGGVGISIHGSHRVATDRLTFAMPETGIGFFPDVGGSYFLPRLSHKMGYYLGLVGARINSDDCIALGIAHHKVASERLPHLIQALAQKHFGENALASVSQVIESFSEASSLSVLQQDEVEIKACFATVSMHELMQNLQSSTNQRCQQAYSALIKKSPTSLMVTFQALSRGANLDFDACMQQDYRLASRFAKGHDFMEGIRALIIDKDQTPKWQPSTLAAVTNTEVEHYFAPLIKELA